MKYFLITMLLVIAFFAIPAEIDCVEESVAACDIPPAKL